MAFCSTARRAGWALAVALGLSVSSAGATPNFPDAVAKHLGLSAPPSCDLCHVGTPGTGTASSLVVKALKERGLQPYDEASLQVALDALEGEKRDSDGDGQPDVAELKEGADPNVKEGESTALEADYGCAMRSGSGTSFRSTGCFALLLALLLQRARCSLAPKSGR